MSWTVATSIDLLVTYLTNGRLCGANRYGGVICNMCDLNMILRDAHVY